MKRTVITAATLAAVAVTAGPISNVFAADPDARAALGAEDKAMSKGSQKEVEKTLTDVIEEVIDKDVEDTIDNFTDKDRERLGKRSEKTSVELKALVTELKDAWKSKYGPAMDVRGAEIPYSITQEDSNKKLAVVTLPTDNRVSGLKLNLVNEGNVTNAWRIDLPDTTTNEELKSNLTRAVRELNESRANWPANEKDAYRIVALKILGAISGSVA